jgi:catechol 2,3-dioxygenase
MAGVLPDRLGHFTLHPKDPEAVRDFLIRVLDFRLTDIIAGDGYFLRCNSDHDGLGLFEGPGTLHHHAWKVQSDAELGRLADLLDQHRLRLLWGPVRHGAGNNIAAYFPRAGWERCRVLRRHGADPRRGNLRTPDLRDSARGNEKGTMSY